MEPAGSSTPAERTDVGAGKSRQGSLQRPDHDLLVYDGDCAFCRWTLDRGRAVLPRFPAADSYQNLDLTPLGLTAARAERAVQLRTRDGRLRAGHRAVGMVLLDQPGIGWRLLGALALTPPTSWVAGVGYRWVARHRGRLWAVIGRARSR